MSGLAVVILAHHDPTHLHRLVAALEGLPVFLHCDARTPAHVAQHMFQGLPPRVHKIPRRATTLASWSLVEAELAGLKEAFNTTPADHIVVMSGSDYPLVPTGELQERLSDWAGHSYVWNQPIPHQEWSTPRHDDGGRWRFEYRFISVRDQIVFWRSLPLRWPVRRRLPPGLQLRASAQWKILCRDDVERLLWVVSHRPDIVRFWRTTLVPEETFVASVLASASVSGGAGLELCDAHPWYISWPGRLAQHPRELRLEDFDALAAVRRAPPLRGATPEPALRRPLPPYQRFFARKFSTRGSTPLLDRIDAELRC